MFYVFEQYSYYIGYDNYYEFNIIFWKHAARIFHDEAYALHHWGKVYPDKKFIEIWEMAYKHPSSREHYIALLNYAIDKMVDIHKSLLPPRK
ncbi:hypothetical protein PG357_06590 [Riemerella anatipestifer]|nr:hypothetical protein [Riemerella anatipestifer]